jgi:hypothetical protein
MGRNLDTVKQIYAALDVATFRRFWKPWQTTWPGRPDNSAAKVGVPWLVPRRGKTGAAGKVIRPRHSTDTAKHIRAAGLR